MRRLLVALALLAFAAPVASGAERPGILYAADARTATVTGSGAALRVALPAASSTAWFTDRPARRAGTTTLAGLVAVWQGSGFDADPPNAALLLTTRGRTTTHVVTLTDPRHARGLVSFRLRVVPGGVEAGYRHGRPIAPGRYGRAGLFIDDAAWAPPCGYMLDGEPCLLGPAAGVGALPSTSDYRVCAQAPVGGVIRNLGAEISYDAPPCAGGASVGVEVIGFFGSTLVNFSAYQNGYAPSLLIWQ